MDELQQYGYRGEEIPFTDDECADCRFCRLDQFAQSNEWERGFCVHPKNMHYVYARESVASIECPYFEEG